MKNWRKWGLGSFVGRCFSKKFLAFSLVELMISLIVISIITAVFVPVITKKLASNSIVAGLGKGTSSNENTNKCGDICTADEILDSDTCTCHPCLNGVCKINNLFVTQYNLGDSTGDSAVLASAGVNVVAPSVACGASKDYSTKCCWQGATSGTSCDAQNGYYSGCNRTVCNWAAANAICENYKKDGRTWRLPTSREISNWGTYSIGLGDGGLMLCSNTAGYKSAYCGEPTCKGAYKGQCYPNTVWSSTFVKDNYISRRYLDKGSWTSNSDYPNSCAFSVRCVANEREVPNCKIYAENNITCKECKEGYYLSNNQCKAVTQDKYCTEYHKTKDECIECAMSYKVVNGKCQAKLSYSNIKGVYVLRYNIGDTPNTQIPTSAGVNVVNVGETCGSKDDYSTKCCWQGETANPSYCKKQNDEYPTCTRTVCNWAAAKAICNSYNLEGRSWRLPTSGEIGWWSNSSKLQLCDQEGNQAVTCYARSKCMGAGTYNNCYAGYVWQLKEANNSNGTYLNAYYYKFVQESSEHTLDDGTTHTDYDNTYSYSSMIKTGAATVRCITDAVPNCGTYNNTYTSCELCNNGYYSTGSTCVTRTKTVENCGTYEPFKDLCQKCTNGYYIVDQVCHKSTPVSKCTVYHETKDACTWCQGDLLHWGGRAPNADGSCP